MYFKVHWYQNLNIGYKKCVLQSPLSEYYKGRKGVVSLFDLHYYMQSLWSEYANFNCNSCDL